MARGVADGAPAAPDGSNGAEAPGPPGLRHIKCAGRKGARPPQSPASSGCLAGDRGYPARRLQRSLRALGYGAVPFDGHYGPRTRLGVRRFQRAHGLEADGICGPRTWGELRKAVRDAGTTAARDRAGSLPAHVDEP